jgi:DNA-directed RNA polymerase
MHRPIDIFESDWKIHKDGVIEYLKINLKYVDKLKNNIIVSPKSLPMICPPAKWSYSKYGGYMENEYCIK